MTQKCEVRVVTNNGWNAHKCNREFKTDAQREAGLCGIHLAAKTRRDERAARDAAAKIEGDRLGAAAEAACSRLLSLGVHARREFSREDHNWTGKVIVDGEALLAALEAK